MTPKRVRGIAIPTAASTARVAAIPRTISPAAEQLLGRAPAQVERFRGLAPCGRALVLGRRARPLAGVRQRVAELLAQAARRGSVSGTSPIALLVEARRAVERERLRGLLRGDDGVLRRPRGLARARPVRREHLGVEPLRQLERRRDPLVALALRVRRDIERPRPRARDRGTARSRRSRAPRLSGRGSTCAGAPRRARTRPSRAPPPARRSPARSGAPSRHATSSTRRALGSSLSTRAASASSSAERAGVLAALVSAAWRTSSSMKSGCPPLRRRWRPRRPFPAPSRRRSRVASSRASSFASRPSANTRTSPGTRRRAPAPRRARPGRCRTHGPTRSSGGASGGGAARPEERQAVGVGPLQVVDREDERAAARAAAKSSRTAPNAQRRRSCGSSPLRPRLLRDERRAPERGEELRERLHAGRQEREQLVVLEPRELAAERVDHLVERLVRDRFPLVAAAAQDEQSAALRWETSSRKRRTRQLFPTPDSPCSATRDRALPRTTSANARASSTARARARRTASSPTARD